MSPDANLARLALVALRAATTEAVAVAADLPAHAALAALEELRAAGEARRDADGTWYAPGPARPR